MKTRWSAVPAVIIAVSLWSLAAPAHGFGGGHGMTHRGAGMSRLILRSVGLTDAQKAEIRQIVASRHSEFRALGEQLRGAREQMAQRLYAPDPVTAAELTPLTQQIAQLRGQLAELRLQVALEVRGVLTPEQLAKAAETRQRLSELRGEMRGLLHGSR